MAKAKKVRKAQPTKRATAKKAKITQRSRATIPEQPGFRGTADRNTVYPRVIDDVLYNPGMGWTTMRAFDGDVPGYPKSTVAYFRWYWSDISPREGEFNWDIIDRTLETAKERGQTVAIRIMPANGGDDVPRWYKELGAKGFSYIPEANVATGKKCWMPDHNDPLYLKHMTEMVVECGKRYDGHPQLDHVDIGSVGHWGEWHFAFVKPNPVVKPKIRRALVDIYLDNFKKTPLVMLIGGRDELKYAVEQGCGWRADCLGDLGYWGESFNHMRDRYQQSLDAAGANDAWKKGIVAFESCGVMQKWTDMGYDVEFIFDEALRWHCSVLNDKSSALPPRWWGAAERFMKRMGYRFVLKSLTHKLEAEAGKRLVVDTEWENLGVAPAYRGYQVAVELRPVGGRGRPDNVVRHINRTDIRKWLPGRHELSVNMPVPKGTPAGRYHLALAMLDPFSKEPAVQLAIEGRDNQGWYPVSQVEIA